MQNGVFLEPRVVNVLPKFVHDLREWPLNPNAVKQVVKGMRQ